MKKVKASFIFLAVCCLLLVVGCLWLFWATRPVCKTNCQPQIFVVQKGEGLKLVAQKLQQQKLIRSALVFRFLAEREKLEKKIQAGDFKLNPAMSSLQIAQELTHGTLDRWVTLLEGWRKEEIAVKLAGSDLKNFKQEEFLEETKNLEGRLFPDTYLIPKEAKAKTIVEILTKNFQKKTPQPSREVLILASIVEREARGKEDKQIVAGILLKRLENKWALQVDATVQYAVATANCKLKTEDCDWWPKQLTKKDLEIKSAYNTYLHRGLPPAPICNPGLISIEAVLNPVKTDYWFYLSDPEGKMHYAKTVEEHKENIEKYLLQ